MFIKNHKCVQCQKEYDSNLEKCPSCRTLNENYEQDVIQKNLFWLPFDRQIALFLIGSLGFQIIGLIVSFFIQLVGASIYPDVNTLEIFLNSIKANSILQFTSYTLLFLALILSIIPYLYKLYSSFINLRALIKGFSYGVFAISFSVLYGLILSFFYETSGNTNQNNLESIISIYPFTSILVFGIIGPICEEFTYRVGLFNFLRRQSKILAYILTIIVFALIHFNFNSFDDIDEFINELINLPSYIIGAFVLTYAYDKDGLGGSCYAHMFNNLFSVIISIVSTRLI